MTFTTIGLIINLKQSPLLHLKLNMTTVLSMTRLLQHM